MKKTMIGIILSTAMAVSACAQGYSQPVREIEKAARSAVRGTCDVSIDPGYSGNLTNCSMADLNQNLGETVPAGKILVIEDINATCSKSNADLTTVLNFRTGGNSLKPVPLQLVRTLSNGRQTWISSQTARLYVKAGENVWVSLDAGNNATQLTSCGVRFQGHLVNAQ
jgi:hypothetical protein